MNLDIGYDDGHDPHFFVEILITQKYIIITDKKYPNIIMLYI